MSLPMSATMAIIGYLSYSILPPIRRFGPPPLSTKASVAISTHSDRRGEPVGSTLCLRANEGLLIERT